MARGCCTARASNDHSTQAGRRLAVRAAFALHLYTQPRTPFCRCAAFLLKGKQEIVPLSLAPTRAGERAGMVAKTLGSIETLSREISCHHGLATFQSEISPLRFAAVEMTVAVSSRAEEHIGMGGKNLNFLNPMNPGHREDHQNTTGNSGPSVA